MRGKPLRIFPFAVALICLGCTFLTMGCSSSSARYRFVQAATGLNNNVDLQVDGKVVQSAVGFGQPATYHSSTSGKHDFKVFPTGTTTNPYADTSVSLSGDTTLIMETTPQTQGATIAVGVFTDDKTAPTTGNVKLRIINVSPTVSANGVDVYVVTSGQGIGGFNPLIPGLTFGNASNYQSLAAGNYDVIMTLPGTQNIVSSLSGTYNLTAGQIRTILVVDNSFGGGPYQQVLLNDLN
jgi:Domain of unknown function (DUF4397)